MQKYYEPHWRKTAFYQLARYKDTHIESLMIYYRLYAPAQRTYKFNHKSNIRLEANKTHFVSHWYLAEKAVLSFADVF